MLTGRARPRRAAGVGMIERAGMMAQAGLGRCAVESVGLLAYEAARAM